MGYKLAGYDVLGCVEIDPEMLAIYKDNHKPKYPFLMSIQEFNKLPDSALPKEFFDLDILDGSPPCSSFSMAGSREKKWGKASQFREGQAFQRLDDLFFHFIETAKRLKPKVVVAENVKGLIQGNAKGYVKEIFQGFKDAGYQCQLFLLNGASMGVPQKRERTFFISNKLGRTINLNFNEAEVNAFDAANIDGYMASGANVRHCANNRRPKWDSKKSAAPTMMATNGIFIERKNKLGYWDKCTALEGKRIQSFPDDYMCKDPLYLLGMSVPPFMMQRIADQIYHQLLTAQPAGS